MRAKELALTLSFCHLADTEQQLLRVVGKIHLKPFAELEDNLHPGANGAVSV